jgi:CheY-like chemotaxis protein
MMKAQSSPPETCGFLRTHRSTGVPQRGPVVWDVQCGAGDWPEIFEDLGERRLPGLADEPEGSPIGTDHARRRILVADDDAAVLSALAALLESEHYGVLQARDGREAIRRFAHDRPDLVLLDLNMPERDGWKAMEIMERTEPFVPVIIITAQPDQWERASSLGVDAIMEKPLDFPLLLRTIADLLRQGRAQRIARLTRADFVTLRLSPERT